MNAKLSSYEIKGNFQLPEIEGKEKQRGLNLSRCCDYLGEKKGGKPSQYPDNLGFNTHTGTGDKVLATYKVATLN